jgi:hypothetical protein
MGDSARVTIRPDDLGFLVWCAMSYDRRLPSEIVPPQIWDALPSDWKGKISHWHHADRDQFGAERRERS